MFKCFLMICFSLLFLYFLQILKLILLKDISGVGRRGEVKNVAEGYASNFLLPRKLATVVTLAAIERLKIEKLKIEKETEIQEENLEKNIEELKNKKVVIKAKASEAGHLFAGIHKEDILKALKEQTGIEIPEDTLELHENIKSLGSYKIPVVFKNKKGELQLEIE